MLTTGWILQCGGHDQLISAICFYLPSCFCKLLHHRGNWGQFWSRIYRNFRAEDGKISRMQDLSNTVNPPLCCLLVLWFLNLPPREPHFTLVYSFSDALSSFWKPCREEENRKPCWYVEGKTMRTMYSHMSTSAPRRAARNEHFSSTPPPFGPRSVKHTESNIMRHEGSFNVVTITMWCPWKSLSCGSSLN